MNFSSFPFLLDCLVSLMGELETGVVDCIRLDSSRTTGDLEITDYKSLIFNELDLG